VPDDQHPAARPTTPVLIDPPSHVSDDGEQRYFGGDSDLIHDIRLTSGVFATVLRWSDEPAATLTLRVSTSGSGAEVRTKATPAELRRIAAALVSAAHDIETHPAATLRGDRA